MSLTCFVCVLWANRGGYVSLAVVFTDARAARVHTDHLPSARVHFLLRCCWRCRWRRMRCHIAWRKGYVGDVSIGRRTNEGWKEKKKTALRWTKRKQNRESFFQKLDTNCSLLYSLDSYCLMEQRVCMFVYTLSPVVYSGSSGMGKSCCPCCSRRRLLSSSSCWAALVTASNWCSFSNFLRKHSNKSVCFYSSFRISQTVTIQFALCTCSIADESFFSHWNTCRGLIMIVTSLLSLKLH